MALDTNRAIGVLNGEARVVERVRRFSQVWLPVPVVGELRYGALNSRRPRENTATIEALVSSCGILEMKDETAKVYARLRLILKQKGHPIPANDVWIAALASSTRSRWIRMIVTSCHLMTCGWSRGKASRAVAHGE